MQANLSQQFQQQQHEFQQERQQLEQRIEILQQQLRQLQQSSIPGHQAPQQSSSAIEEQQQLPDYPLEIPIEQQQHADVSLPQPSIRQVPQNPTLGRRTRQRLLRLVRLGNRRIRKRPRARFLFSSDTE
ncbi:unnamed protein product [Adineta ricciae]|uniref:Uncharacterized protein n=1 Tax=Adineta ricciae TaxID=249248 RepID=A0A815SSF3_ADIRI|nr:unnamed protein product [Adineta ricciae]